GWHWERIYGRAPALDDLVVPARTMAPVKAYDAVEAFKHDLAELGLHVEAGEHRDRGGHDLRSWYMTATVECGCESLVLRAYNPRRSRGRPGGLPAVQLGHHVLRDLQAPGVGARRRGPAAPSRRPKCCESLEKA